MGTNNSHEIVLKWKSFGRKRSWGRVLEKELFDALAQEDGGAARQPWVGLLVEVSRRHQLSLHEHASQLQDWSCCLGTMPLRAARPAFHRCMRDINRCASSAEGRQVLEAMVYRALGVDFGGKRESKYKDAAEAAAAIRKRRR